MNIEMKNAAQNQQVSRRRLLRTVGRLGLATAGAVVLRPTVGAFALTHQDATPAAGPELGEQPDGTHLWRVKVGGMDMDNLIDMQAFLPSEITINAGDAIWFEFDMMPGFHTVTFPVGGEPPSVLIPDPDAGTPGTDAPPTLILNPEFALPLAVRRSTGPRWSTPASTCSVIRRRHRSFSHSPSPEPMTTSARRTSES